MNLTRILARIQTILWGAICLSEKPSWKEPWVEEIYENKKIVEKSRDGRERSITIPVKRLIQHPGEWITNAYAEVEFTLKDRSTGRTVYNCIDTRERQDSGYDGMLNRICNDFVSDVK